MVKILNSELPGKVAIKLHSGEVGNQNFLRPEFMKPVIDYVDGTRLENFLRIVKENITSSVFIWGVEGCKIIVETNTGSSIDAFGQKVRFYFFKSQKEETK